MALTPSSPGPDIGADPGSAVGRAPRTSSASAAADGDNGLQPFYTQVGNLKLSLDAVGMSGSTGVVQVDKPVGATVRKAFMFSASTGFSSYTPVDGDVTIDGAPVSWLPALTRTNGIQSVNVAADVTSLVTAKLAAAPPGRVDLTIGEGPTDNIDGEILAVVWNDPAAKSQTIYLMYGAQSTTGDSFGVNLDEPLKPSSTATMSLGITFGYQPAGQYSQIDVNGRRVSTSAGGQDDGSDNDGSLITVGGLDDDASNPADPTGTDDCPAAPRCDDELYDLKAAVASGTTSIDVTTQNPSNDDNVMFAAFVVSGVSAVIDNSVGLSPSGSRQQVGTSHSVVATVRDSSGELVKQGFVSFDVVSGPNAGSKLLGIRLPDGRVIASYSSTKTGIDVIRATTEISGQSQVSNDVTQEWIPSVAGTFGGAWPFNGSLRTLYYTYGGGHRYLGNIVQGASNWAAAPTKIKIEPWPGVPAPIHLPVQDVYRNDSWWGMTVFTDDCVECGYTSNAILMNQRTLDRESDAQSTLR